MDGLASFGCSEKPARVSVYFGFVLTPANVRSGRSKHGFLPSAVFFGCALLLAPHAIVGSRRHAAGFTIYPNRGGRGVLSASVGGEGPKHGPRVATDVLSAAYPGLCNLAAAAGRAWSHGCLRVYLFSILISPGRAAECRTRFYACQNCK